MSVSVTKLHFIAMAVLIDTIVIIDYYKFSLESRGAQPASLKSFGLDWNM